MISSLHRRLTYANVMATIAVFIALGGTGAWATHEVILSSDIVDGEVKMEDIGTAQVRTADIGTGQVRSIDVADDNTAFALTGTDIGADAIRSSDVANNSLRLSDYALVQSTTVNVAALGAHSCAALTSFVSGAQNGDSTLVVPLSLELGLVTMGLTSNVGGQVRWRMCNISTNTIDPASQIFKFILLR